ncbi:MAG TPA: EAL domain-containing protein [Acidimicrobiales bacterium]|nr:EAL domain-containing protein [Acidimicrobiales bacterium]
MLGSWSVHQLVEFLAALSEDQDERSALLRAAELASETIGAELGAVVVDGAVVAAVGFGTGAVPEPELLYAALGTSETVLPVIGPCHLAVVEVFGDADRLLVGRLTGTFGPEERNLLAGMGRVLGLSLRTLRILAAERDLRLAQEQLAEERLRSVTSLEQRQLLLETLLTLQRSISHRAPLPEILDTVTAGATSLLGAGAAWLFLRDDLDPSRPIIASTAQRPSASARDAALDLARAAMAARGRRGTSDTEVLRSGRFVAAAVHVGGSISGALVTESSERAGADSDDDRLLVTFAEHASMALTDARTVAAVKEAFHDPLTGLPNRALFLDRVEQALDAAGREPHDVAVLFIDLDRFKAVNDSLGHAAGDELLRAVARRLSACLGSSAVVARFGGDEFAVLLEEGATLQEATGTAQRIIERLRDPFSVQGYRVLVGASIGIAFAEGALSEAPDLLRNADLAMYRAKKDGRGGWSLFEPGMYLAVRNRLELEADLQRAVARGELTVQYQPVVLLDSGEITGLEALARWDHPVHGRISPDTFIPLAEEIGVIDGIGRWVLKEACRRLADWRREQPDLRVHVNLSVHQLHDPDIVESVRSVLAAQGLAPESLTLEITEGTFLERNEMFVVRLRELKCLGVDLAVDDFGTGYSSLGYLRQFPIDTLKIDRSFVEGVDADHECAALARSIVELGNTLGLATVAEGVENGGQLEFLRSVHCRYGQGFHFSEPIDASTVPALLAARRQAVHAEHPVARRTRHQEDHPPATTSPGAAGPARRSRVLAPPVRASRG